MQIKRFILFFFFALLIGAQNVRADDICGADGTWISTSDTDSHAGYCQSDEESCPEGQEWDSEANGGAGGCVIPESSAGTIGTIAGIAGAWVIGTGLCYDEKKENFASCALTSGLSGLFGGDEEESAAEEKPDLSRIDTDNDGLSDERETSLGTSPLLSVCIALITKFRLLNLLSRPSRFA